MKQTMKAVSKALVRGLLIVVPVYLAILLLLKGMKTVANLVRPFTAILPDWVPAEDLLSLLLVLAICAFIGASVGTRIGRGVRDWLERTVLERIPGYGVIRSLTHQMAGEKPGEHVDARAGRDRRCPCPGVYHRRVGGRSLHRLHPVDPHAVCGRRLCFGPAASTSGGRAVHRCDQGRLALGMGSEGLVAAMEHRESIASR